MKLDPTKLTPEQRDKLEAYQQSETQIQALQDIAAMTHELISVVEGQKKHGSEATDNIGRLLLDVRESLKSINDKETPETPDYAKPVIAGFDKLEKALTSAIKSIDVKPDAPQVNVTPSNVDLKGVEKVLKDMPKAFQSAIKLIPKIEIPETNFRPLLDAWEGISEQLLSIENATRMKPLPGVMKVTNPDGSTVGGGGLTDTELRATPVPVSGTVAVTGVATAANQLPNNHNVVVTSAPTTAVTGTFFQATQPVSAASLPLPSGAATSTNQTDGTQQTNLYGTLTKYTKTITASGDTEIIAAPGASFKIRLFKFGYSADGGNAAGTVATLKFGASEVDKQWLDPKQPYADGLTNRYVDLSANTALNVNLSAAVSVGVYVNVAYQTVAA